MSFITPFLGWSSWVSTPRFCCSQLDNLRWSDSRQQIVSSVFAWGRWSIRSLSIDKKTYIILVFLVALNLDSCLSYRRLLLSAHLRQQFEVSSNLWSKSKCLWLDSTRLTQIEFMSEVKMCTTNIWLRRPLRLNTTAAIDRSAKIKISVLLSPRWLIEVERERDATEKRKFPRLALLSLLMHRKKQLKEGKKQHAGHIVQRSTCSHCLTLTYDPHHYMQG